MLDLSYDSENDSARPRRGYAAALVSPSLGSESSFRLPSPVRSPSTKPRASDRLHRHNRESSSPDSSLDELIDSFRASASSLKFVSGRGDGMRTGSPVKSTHTATGVPHVKPKGILRTDARQAVASDRNSDSDVVGLSPMPKLTYVPKAKPTLSMPAPTKPRETSSIRRPSKLQSPKFALSSRVDRRKPNRSKLSSPTKHKNYEHVTTKNRTPPSPPPSPPSTDPSTVSSVLEDIDAPDSDDVGEMSVDDLISRDLSQLQRLVSSSREQPVLPKARLTNRSLTSEDVERTFQRSTRFRDDSDDNHVSSFRLYSPHDRAESTSPFGLDPVQSLSHRTRASENQSPLEDDSFVEELRTMKSNLLKEKEKKKAADEDAKKKQEEAEKKKAADGPGANIGSLREAVDAIDKTLLLALRPFDKLKQEQEKEDAEAATAEEKLAEHFELPMATQALVEQLEQTFGGLTRQREAELKAEEDAAAEAKAAEEAKKKEDEEKKAKEEAERKRDEEKILSLLPLRGKLMNTESDVYDALTRLEVAETMARNSVRYQPSDHDTFAATERDLASLQEFATRRAREIEDQMYAPPHLRDAPRAISWHRSTFHVDDDAPSVEDSTALDLSPPEADSFSDVLQAEVVEKLDFTILKLRHALAIDQKEAAEAAARSQAIAKETAAREKKEAEEKSKQEKIDLDSAAARQRVMGISSLHELPWVSDTDASLQKSTPKDQALQTLQSSLDQTSQVLPIQALPSFFDEQQALDRFESLRMMIEAPHFLPLYKSHLAPSRPSREVTQPAQHSRVYDRENISRTLQGYDYHYEAFDHVHEPQHRRRSKRGNRTVEDNYPRPTISDNQIDDRKSSLWWDSSPRAVKGKSLQLESTPSRTRYLGTEHKDRLMDTKRAIRDLQANRVEKALWFHSSTRSR